MGLENRANYTGGCACGAIRYEVTAQPVTAFHCQCASCQKATGAGHASAMVFPRAAAKVTGSPKFHESPADGGNIARRGFRTQCGSLVLFHAQAQPWDAVDPALPTFCAAPPAPERTSAATA